MPTKTRKRPAVDKHGEPIDDRPADVKLVENDRHLVEGLTDGHLGEVEAEQRAKGAEWYGTAILIEATEALAREIVRLRKEVDRLNTNVAGEFDEVRARRLVVVDEDGDERILLAYGETVAGTWLDVASIVMRNHVGDRTVTIRTGENLTSLTMSAGRVLPGEINQACLEIACVDGPSSVGDSKEPAVSVTAIDAYNQMDVIADTRAESDERLDLRGHQRQLDRLAETLGVSTPV